MQAITPPTPLPSANNFGTHIEQLEGARNFYAWKFAIRMSLMHDGLWDLVEKGGTEGDARDQRALARICLAMKPSLYQYVRTAKTSKEAWKSLADVFEDSGLVRRVLLLRQLHRVDYSNFNNMTDYIETIMMIVQQLADIGKTIDDKEVAEILLSGLSSEYDTLVSSLETVNMTSTLTSEVVRARLLQEESRKSTDDHTAFISEKKNFKRRCHYCKKVGHIKKNCFKLKRDRKTTDEKTLIAAALMAHPKDLWFVDSGATAHMCNNKDYFINFRPNHSKITVANNEELECIGTGDIHLNINGKVHKLCNVLFVPKLSTNLISVSKLIDNNFNVTFNRGGCIITDLKGKHIASALSENGMFRFKSTTCEPLHNKVNCMFLHGQEATNSAVTDRELLAELWHKRLGHINYRDLHNIWDRIPSGSLFQKNDISKCVPCLEGKLAAKPFPKGPSKVAEQPLALIHSDVCGPLPISLGGARYLLTFTDDCTRKSFGYLLKRKSEVCDHFIQFVSMVERQMELRVKCLRSDNGGEYVNIRLSNFMKGKGILHQTTVPYCPQQNAVSERLNRTLMTKVRCMLQHSGLDRRFWAEAVMTAIYLKNRSPTAALGGRIPEEVWTGSKLDLSHLRVFGCVAYICIYMYMYSRACVRNSTSTVRLFCVC
ncbi:unnamed protein product [Euphydryas editha]|uniref:Polyprotein n=1 Tax=Euphydryas editha TaxID=104508 RepID=A0AAU9UQX1_EUPED|nr:unnamed protein product [Euphydryas editha]